MKLLFWNILHGGGTRRDAICSALAAHDPDVIVLNEVRANSIREIKSSLWMQPWRYTACAMAEPNDNSVCIFSRVPLNIRNCCPVPDENAARWLDVYLPACGFGIGALHIPTTIGQFDSNGSSKRRFWSALVKAAVDRIDEPFMFIGDLNTGRRGIDEPGRTFVCSDKFEQMTDLGWIDAWRRYHGLNFEPSWVSPKGIEYRLDHAFVSPPLLDRLVSCRYSHKERQAKISDHSILMLEVAASDPR